MSEASKAVFLSYAREDADTARGLAEALRGEGVEVWFDESELRGGEAWDASIRRQIRDCALFVPIISARTQQRREGYFRLEWKLADERSHLIAEGQAFILPVVADGTKERDALVPKSFLNVQWTWLPHGEVPPAFPTRVHRLLGGGASASPGSENRKVFGASASSTVPASARTPDKLDRGTRARWPFFLPWALVLLLAAILLWTRRAAGPAPESGGLAAPAGRVTHAVITLPANAPLAPTRAFPFGLSYPSLALAPDGSLLVYVALVGQTTQLFLRPLDQPEARPISGTEGAYHPFFSPDGRWVGFFADNKVKKVSVLGGAPIALCNSGDELHGAAWGDDGMIYFAPNGEVRRVRDSGGPVEPGPDWPPGVRSLEVMPGVKRILGYVEGARTRSISADYRPIMAMEVTAKEPTPVVERGYHPRFVPPGHLVFARGDDLFAAAFDPAQRKPAGEPVPLLEGVTMDALNAVAQYAVSASGTLVYAAGGAGDRATPAWVDRRGRARKLPMEAQTYGEVQLSPDGRHLAIVVAGVTDTIWVIDTETGKGAALAEPGANSRPVWTHDGKRLIFTSQRPGKNGLYWKAWDGREPAELLYESRDYDVLTALACLPTTNQLLFARNPFTSRSAMAVLSLDGSGKVETVPGMENVIFARFSPDYQWMSFSSAESGRSEVYVMRYPQGPVTRVSSGGGEEPLWSPKGDELFFRNRDAWMVAPVSLQPAFKAGPPRELFRGPFLNVPGYSEALSADGQEFLMLMPEQPDAPVTQLHGIVNWSEELRRRVPFATASTLRSR